LLVISALLCMAATRSVLAADETPAPDAARDAYEAGLKALAWVKGPTSVPVAGNATLTIPENYVFLDAANTAKFVELNENLSNGKEVMVAPADLHWSAYLEFDDGGYVKDDEKIDADALLKSLQEGAESSNAERVKRGWSALHVLGWASAPAYNRETKRLEWATTLRSDNGTGVNFFTKILGRRGHTSIVMVSSQNGLSEAETSLNTVLDGYAYNKGETYAEWKPGDKVAEYGLAALVLGGAAAVATKKGLWAVIASFMAAAWKAVAAAVVAAGAWLRNRFKKKD
jgi:uncharacterized membrane-anchored protein